MSEAGRRCRRVPLHALIVLALATATLTALGGPASARTGPSLAFIVGPSNQSAGQVIAPAIQVAAKDARGQINTRFTKPITVALQGAGTLFGTKTVAAVAGIATFADLIVDQAGTHTLIASSGRLAPALSNPFDITGGASDCDGGPCTASSGNIDNPTPEDTIIGVVSVGTTACGSATCFLTVDETSSDFCNGPCSGNAVKFITPSNSSGIVEILFGCDKSLCAGTGVPNFTLYMQKADLSVVQLFDCSNPTPDPSELPCIKDRSRTGVGDAKWTIWATADGDPAIGRG